MKINQISVILIMALFFNNCDNSTTETYPEEIETNRTVENIVNEEVILFPSLDSLLISAKVFSTEENNPWILLCHQANFNLHAYDEIAPKLNQLGFNCLAIDQRSGGSLFEIDNETHLRAIEKELPTEYINAEQDMIAAINYLKEKHNQEIMLWGSSYSSSLALKIAHENENVKAVLSFSPGEYFGEELNLQEAISGLDKPCFITSSKSEANENLDKLTVVIESENFVQFIPQADGIHGSKALWVENDSHEEYWDAVKSFLETI